MAGLAEMLKSHGSDEETGTDEEEQAEGDEEGKALSNAIFDAIKAGDRDAFHEGLEAFVMHCSDMGEEMGEAPPASEPGKKKSGLAIILGK